MSSQHISSLYQALANTVEIMHRHGVFNIVLCPGSRSAPLAISFIRSQKFECYHLVDERSAAYFALGLAKASGRPAALVCTSGTAAYNFAPAIAEAYFQEIPLIVCSADRPAELIGQNDNQAIFQQNIYGKHVLSFCQMPENYSVERERKWAFQKVNDACLTAYGEKQGPVHLNFPFREPFYPDKDYLPQPEADLKIIGRETGVQSLNDLFLNDVKAVINQSSNVWLLAGMCLDTPSEALLHEFAEKTNARLFIDPLSNLHLPNQLYHFDDWLKNEAVQKPDLVISFGNHFLSKWLKLFLRENAPANHLHISEHGQLADPFGSINFVVKSHVDDFFNQLNQFSFEPGPANELLLMDSEYAGKPETDKELLAAERVLKALPNGSVLHLGNSSPVRYLLKWNHLLKNKAIEVYANRGTSGIDGSVSTALAMAQDDDRPHFLLIGDLSMYYDRNGLWHNYLPQNIKIMVMNNGGGGIFTRIKGPKEQPELESYFVNKQWCDFEQLARAHQLHFEKRTHTELNETILHNFFAIEKIGMMEIVLD
ncbi:2-succinyl-5-enolpyruvyl-6-hydroxy-3-cyclohexene-1-carboxylic-acid synthase [bacterium]|nr:2-succinyl-5-enolpyruvyl-6-hydroxy-3-cyclohexene-1-carboxylic-acid synthase [bacterium]